jgi:predicted TIM-barrel fold metal-dependent hydrolase
MILLSPHFTVSGIRERKDLTPKQKDKILGENAARLLNL